MIDFKLLKDILIGFVLTIAGVFVGMVFGMMFSDGDFSKQNLPGIAMPMFMLGFNYLYFRKKFLLMGFVAFVVLFVAQVVLENSLRG